MERYICIHGHFYQPPRENPWLESIELQDSAYPYHDWNERITMECYAPNGAARILDARGNIEKIVNLYSRISFNFGPTLLSWMEARVPEVYQSIRQADKESRTRYGGHGSAIAQAYNHIIMPLANSRDKKTQVRWGLRDFERRFERKSEGFWLPETAVDLETLDLLLDEGIKFVVLAPHQASKVRRKGAKSWTSVEGGKIDPTMAYEVRLPSNRAITAFFYDGPISQAVAFEGLLKNGDTFANRLVGGFSEKRTWSQLVHIATDGETYGHHHRYGEMALAFALNTIEKKNLARLTNYGEFLEKHPPTWDAEILENTSWSCVHGVERWRSNCGCNSGGRPRWHQLWRAPLRESLDWLRDELAAPFEEKARTYLRDPWTSRDDYIDVILNRDRKRVIEYFKRHQTRDLTIKETIEALKLLELQRQTLLMYTSCGWFFDELSGIEATQVLHYAGRALQLSQELFGDHREDIFEKKLENAKSNLPQYGNGKFVYENFVKPARVDLNKVGAHYAISSLFQESDEGPMTFSFHVEREDYRSDIAGRVKMAFGRIKVQSDITWEETNLTFCVLHMGDHNLTGGVRPYSGPEAYQAMLKDMRAFFTKADYPAMIRSLDRHFSSNLYSLHSLFRDQQRLILNSILKSTLESAEAEYRQIYDTNAPLLKFLQDLKVPMPSALQMAAEFVLNANLRQEVEKEDLDFDQINAYLDEANQANIKLDMEGIGFAFSRTLEKAVVKLKEGTDRYDGVTQAQRACQLAMQLPFDVNLWKVQNEFYQISKTLLPQMKARVEKGDQNAQGWVDAFLCLGQELRVRTDAHDETAQPQPA